MARRLAAVSRARLAAVPRLRVDAWKLDAALAALLTLGAELEVWLVPGAARQRLIAAVVSPLVTGAVALRRRHPAAVAIGASLLLSAQIAFWNDPQVVSVAVAYFCELYALTVWTPPRRFAAGLATIAAASLLSAAGPRGSLKGGVPFTAVTVVVMLLVRRVIGDRERRARIAERERDVAAREAVVEERARIARELHDVVAHHVSMIVVQAGAERRVLDRHGASTHEVLRTIEDIGRSALTEMRRLVGMLRSDIGYADEPLTPQPGLADVPRLVAQVREAGLPVELRIDGEPRELPVGIELSAHRIVQEALTNALKHAGDARASVHVHYGAESLELEIVDDGPGAAPAAGGGGHGLVGMRERVALYGGRLDASSRAGGGFAVRALLPIR